MERTLILLKPDCVKRGLCGQVISRLENAGLQIKGAKMIALSEDKIKEHYAQYVTADFFPALRNFMSSGPVMALVVEGPEAIKLVRKLCGATNSAEALPGTIRGDYSATIDANIIHASDSPETAALEIPRFFQAAEVLKYINGLTYFEGTIMAENSAIRVASGVILKNSKGAILFGKTNKPPIDDCWVLPAGGVNFGEPLTKAALRELKEETGLDAKIGLQICAFEIIAPESNRHRIVIYYEATLMDENQVIKCGDDLDEARFFTPEEFKQVKTTRFMIPLLIQLKWLT